MTVVTVTGEIQASDINVALVHEHLVVAFPGAEFDPLYRMNRAEIVDAAVGKLIDLKAYGVNTLIDPTPVELGRFADIIQEAAERAEMNIICSTGFYYEAVGLPFYWRTLSAEKIAEFYIRELTLGIGDTGIRPGVIKCATGAPVMTSIEKKFLEAACIAQKETGVPIITHTQDGLWGPEQAQFFIEMGIPPSKCLIGHSCGNADPAYHSRIVEQEVFIGFDRIGYNLLQPDAVRADRIADLVRQGRVGQIMLSQDKPLVWLGRYPLIGSDEQVREHDRLRAEGSWPIHPSYLFTDFLPELRKRGIGEDDIAQMLTGNVRRYFS